MSESKAREESWEINLCNEILIQAVNFDHFVKYIVYYIYICKERYILNGALDGSKGAYGPENWKTGARCIPLNMTRVFSQPTLDGWRRTLLVARWKERFIQPQAETIIIMQNMTTKKIHYLQIYWKIIIIKQSGASESGVIQFNCFVWAIHSFKFLRFIFSFGGLVRFKPMRCAFFHSKNVGISRFSISKNLVFIISKNGQRKWAQRTKWKDPCKVSWKSDNICGK